MKNVYGVAPPIFIEIDNYQNFGHVAFLVDRDDFLKDIAGIRKELGIMSVPYVFPKYPYKVANAYANLYRKREFGLDETITMLKEFCLEKDLKDLSALDKTLGPAVASARSLTSKYHKGGQYFPVVLASILVGTVHKEDFAPTQILTLDTIQQLPSEPQGSEPVVAIRVGRESVPGDVQKDFSLIYRA